MPLNPRTPSRKSESSRSRSRERGLGSRQGSPALCARSAIESIRWPSPTCVWKLRAGIDTGNWRQKGEEVLAALAGNDRPVVLAIDELPILVNRLLKGYDYRITPERR